MKHYEEQVRDHRSEGNHEVAINVIEKLIRINPSKIEYRIALGEELAEIGRYKEAEKGTPLTLENKACIYQHFSHLQHVTPFLVLREHNVHTLAEPEAKRLKRASSTLERRGLAEFIVGSAL